MRKVSSTDLMAANLALTNAKNARIASNKLLFAVDKNPALLAQLPINLEAIKNLQRQTMLQEMDCQALLRAIEAAQEASRMQGHIKRYNGQG